MYSSPIVRAVTLASLALAASTAAAAPAKKPVPPPPAASTAAKNPLTESEARELTVEISAAVESLRGLKFERPVAVKFVDDAEARRHFKARLDRFWPADQVAMEQTVQTQLGLLPPGTDVVSALLDLLEEQAGGYYDPDSDTFFILTDMPRSVAPVLFAHELTHAVDDQHFDLDKRLADAMKDDDRGTAVGAVIEGSGMMVMSAYMLREIQARRLTSDALRELQETEAGQAQKLKNAPPLMQRLLLAPYLLGQAFLQRGNPLAMAHGISAEDINEAFARPPDSTEQLLHPQKYWVPANRDEPRTVTLPDLSARLGEGWKLATTGTLGELTLAVLTGAQPIDPRAATPARPDQWTNPGAAGWGGDLYQLYEGPGGRTVTTLATVWDTQKDATEFAGTLIAAAPKVCAERGDAVVLVAAPDDVDGSGLANALLDAVAPRQ
jgi:hypothetical protein